MNDQKKRKNYYTANKYQKKIVLLAFLPILTICLALSILFAIFFNELVDVIVYQSAAESVQFVTRWGNFFIAVIWGFYVSVIIWAFHVSKNLVGAFERIIRELDDFIVGKRTTPIKARDKDELANQLLKRINTIIKNSKS